MPNNSSIVNRTEEFNIPFGSCYVYYSEWAGGEIPADSAIETDANRVGYVEGGCTVNYTMETADLKDDFGKVRRRVLTAEDAGFKCQFASWSSSKMGLFTPTARIVEANGKRKIKIGGLQNDSGKNYLFRLHHPDAEMGDVRITIVGRQQGGFELAFSPEKANSMVLDVKAITSDDEGTLIIYEEEIPSGSSASTPH